MKFFLSVVRMAALLGVVVLLITWPFGLMLNEVRFRYGLSVPDAVSPGFSVITMLMVSMVISIRRPALAVRRAALAYLVIELVTLVVVHLLGYRFSPASVPVLDYVAAFASIVAGAWLGKRMASRFTARRGVPLPP